MNKLILLVIFCSILGAFGQFFFKVGVEPFSLKKLIFGLFLYGLATILYIFALRGLDLSIAYPIIALSYLWVLLLSWGFLNESINGFKIAGTIFLIMSVGMINYG